MQTLLAKLVTENHFAWFFPVAIALIAVLAAEIVCIVFLVRKILSAKKGETTADQANGAEFAPMLVLLVSQSGIKVREISLLVLAALALAGAVALVVLFAVCYKKGYLFVPQEKKEEPARKISVFDFLPKKAEKEEPAPQKKEEDISSAIAAFADAEEEDTSAAQESYVPEYRPNPYLKYDEYEDEEPEEDEDADDIEDLPDDDPDAEEEDDFDESEASNDPDLFTGNERVVGYDAETDCNIVARYRKSFEAKLIQAQPQIKRYYGAIKNSLLSYKGTKSRVSWTADSFHNGRTQIAKVNVKSRILELYLALDPASLEGTVYRGQDVGALRKYEETPFRYKIRTPRKLNWALELIRRVCEEHGLSPIDIEPVDYENQYPFDTMDNLVKRKLVKVTTRLEKVANTFELEDDKQPEPQPQPEPYFQKEEPSWDFEEEIEESKPASAVEPEPAPQEELFEPDAPVEEIPEPAPTERKLDTDLVQVDVSLLDAHFIDGDYVTLDILKRRGLVYSGATRLKIRATGKMNHKLTIVANQFTYDALLAIGEAGGDAQFIR